MKSINKNKPTDFIINISGFQVLFNINEKEYVVETSYDGGIDYIITDEGDLSIDDFNEEQQEVINNEVDKIVSSVSNVCDDYYENHTPTINPHIDILNILEYLYNDEKSDYMEVYGIEEDDFIPTETDHIFTSVYKVKKSLK